MRKSLPARPRSRSRRKVLSLDLTQFIKKQYPTKVPIVMITGISKLYCKSKPTTKDSKIIKRFAQNPIQVNTARFVQYLGADNEWKKGAQLADDHVKRIYQGFCNPEGKMTFEYLMKMGEQTGFPVSEKVAKAIVKKYGKKKEFVNVDDCQKVIKRRYANLGRKISPQNTPRANLNFNSTSTIKANTHQRFGSY